MKSNFSALSQRRDCSPDTPARATSGGRPYQIYMNLMRSRRCSLIFSLSLSPRPLRSLPIPFECETLLSVFVILLFENLPVFNFKNTGPNLTQVRVRGDIDRVCQPFTNIMITVP